MELKKLPYDLSICKMHSAGDFSLKDDFYFIGKTDEEISLVCRTEAVPGQTIARDDGWKGFRIQGVLDFSLIGILSRRIRSAFSRFQPIIRTIFSLKQKTLKKQSKH